MMGMVALAATLMQPLTPAPMPHVQQVAQRMASMSVGIVILPRGQGVSGTSGATSSARRIASPAPRTSLIRQGDSTIILSYN
jgi:hypothetical protein